MFHIVLLEPEIPSNTGNIGRTCLVTGSSLHLIGPLGFILNDRYLKRAGMDYWNDLDVTIYDSWNDFVRKHSGDIAFVEAGCPEDGSGLSRDVPGCGERIEKSRIWMASTKAQRTHDSVSYRDGDYIMFGKESAGIPETILRAHREHAVRIPMACGQRSLNLANSVAVVLYEALRQNQYPGLTLASPDRVL